MGNTQGAAAFISDGATGSPQTLTGVEIRRCVTSLLWNATTRAFGARSGRRAGAGGVPTISGTTVTVPAGSAVVDAGAGNLDSAFLVSWGSALPTIAGTPADSSQPRVDVVYVRVVEVLGAPTTQTITFGYQAGTASSSPAAPTTVGSDSLPIGQVAVLGYVNVPASGGGAATVTPGPVAVASGGIQPVAGTAADNPDGTYLGQYRDSPVHGLQRWNSTVWDDPDPRGEVGAVANAAQADATTGGAGNPGVDIVTLTVALVAGRRYKVSAQVTGNQITSVSATTRAKLVDSAALIPDDTVYAIYRQNVDPAVNPACVGATWRRVTPTSSGNVTFRLNGYAAAGALRVLVGAASILVEDLGRG